MNKEPRALALKVYGLGIMEASIQAKVSVTQKLLGGALYDLKCKRFGRPLGSRGQINDVDGLVLRDKLARVEGDGS